MTRRSPWVSLSVAEMWLKRKVVMGRHVSLLAMAKQVPRSFSRSLELA